MLDCVTEGRTPEALYSSAIKRNLVSTLEYAAYLGRQLALVARSTRTGEPYAQDRAPGKVLASGIRSHPESVPVPVAAPFHFNLPRIMALVGTPTPDVTSTWSLFFGWLTEVPRMRRTPSFTPLIP